MHPFNHLLQSHPASSNSEWPLVPLSPLYFSPLNLSTPFRRTNSYVWWDNKQNNLRAFSNNYFRKDCPIFIWKTTKMNLLKLTIEQVLYKHTTSHFCSQWWANDKMIVYLWRPKFYLRLSSLHWTFDRTYHDVQAQV